MIVMEVYRKYYDWLIEKSEGLAGDCDDQSTAECLRRTPQFFAVIVALAAEPSLPELLRQTAAAVTAYFVLPTDYLPEATLGITGFKDDLFLAALYLDHVRTLGYAEAVSKHWKPATNVYECVDQILHCEQKLVTVVQAANMRKALAEKLELRTR